MVSVVRQDRAEAAHAGGTDSLSGTEAFFRTQMVGVFDQHQRVIDHHATEGDDAHHADNRQVVAHHHVPQHGTDHAEGDGDHHGQGLQVAFEGDHQKNVDH